MTAEPGSSQPAAQAPALPLPTPAPPRGPSLCRLVTDPVNLYAAWEAVRAGDMADAIPSVQASRFAADLTGNIARIAEELEGGTYAPGPLQRIDLPKRNGGVRRLRVPSIRDRVAERAVGQVVAPLLDPSLTPWSFAYRAGLGVRDAIRTLAALRDEGAAWVVRGDFADCFDSLDRGLLLATLADHCPDPWLLSLAERLLARPARHWRWLERRTRGTPQGAPLSPLLCNLYLHRFDESMLGRGHPVVRFADDFAIPAGDKADADAALAAAREEAAMIHLELNEDKTRLAAFQEGFPFLGTDFGDVYPAAEPDGARPEPARKVVYVGVQGARLRLHDGQLHVDHDDELLLTIPISHVGQIVLFGNVGLSAYLRSHTLIEGIEVVFLSRRGHWLGRLDGPRAVNTTLRKQQYRAADDEALRLALARGFVAGKLANLRALLLRYHRRDAASELLEAARELEATRRQALQAERVGSLLGLEGTGSKRYFAALAHLLPTELGFQGRNRRPPRDPANAALSLGYSLLLGEVVAALAAAGLDPHVGFLHVDEQGRPSLALDLMEEFRPLLVDAVVVACFRRGILDAASVHSDQQRGGVLLTDAARRRFLQAYEERLLATFAHVPSGQRTSYRRALFLQARQIADCIRGARAAYQPVSWR